MPPNVVPKNHPNLLFGAYDFVGFTHCGGINIGGPCHSPPPLVVHKLVAHASTQPNKTILPNTTLQLGEGEGAEQEPPH